MDDGSEALQRIANIFETLRYTLKNKNCVEWAVALKRDIQMLRTELAVLCKESHEAYVRALAMEGYLALLSVKTLPSSATEKHNILHTFFEKLKPFALREECLFIFLRIQNLLCYYLIQLEQITQCREILENTEKLYDEISKYQPDRYLDAENLFTTEPIHSIKRVHPEKIDKVISNNIQMQAFLYNKLNQPEKYVLYNHTALRRQLEMKEGTPQEWALRTARLGNYFTFLNQFGNAHHHLCAAYHVLRNCHDKCKLMPTEFALQKNDFEIFFLELTHHWIKYGLNLFKFSKKNILNSYFTNTPSPSGPNLWKNIDLVDDCNTLDEKMEGENIKDSSAEKKDKGDNNDQKIFKFPTLDLKAMESNVPFIATDLKSARKLFVFTHKWLMRSKRYYDFETHAAQYASCALQLAELYEHLAFFEHNIDNQYSIQKRRADVLENLNSLLKSSENLMPLRIDIIRELSQVQLELMALNLQKLWREESQVSVMNLDSDGESIINSLDSASNKMILEKTFTASSKNIFMRKMEAATAINSRLFRLSGQLGQQEVNTPSQLSFGTSNKN